MENFYIAVYIKWFLEPYVKIIFIFANLSTILHTGEISGASLLTLKQTNKKLLEI